MNYIAEINSFYDWITFNHIPTDAQALWHTLMHMNNKCAVKVNNDWFWRVEFTVSNVTILSILDFSRKQLDRMRNVLIQAGRIMYRKGNGNQCGVYQIIPFDAEMEANYVENFPEKVWITGCVSLCPTNCPTVCPTNVTQPVPQPVPQMSHNLSTLINNNNIYNNKNNILPSDGGVISPDGTRARARENTCDELCTELDKYHGMTDELKLEISEFTQLLFNNYFGRQPSNPDVVNVFERIRAKASDGNCLIDTNKQELLDYAFGQAARTDCTNWRYIDGVLANLRDRGLNSRRDCEFYDIEREEGNT